MVSDQLWKDSFNCINGDSQTDTTPLSIGFVESTLYTGGQADHFAAGVEQRTA